MFKSTIENTYDNSLQDIAFNDSNLDQMINDVNVFALVVSLNEIFFVTILINLLVKTYQEPVLIDVFSTT